MDNQYNLNSHIKKEFFVKTLFFVSAIFFVLFCGCAPHKISRIPLMHDEPVIEQPAVKIKKATISFAGDCTLGGDRERQGYYGHFDWYFNEIAKKDHSYFLSGVKEIFEKDDYTIVNLECPLTDFKNIREKDPKAAKTGKKNEKKPPKKSKHKYYNFKGLPEYAIILSSGNVDAVSMANNHSYDYGQEGYDETLQTLKKFGIDYAAYDDYILKEINDIKIGVLSYAQISHKPASKSEIKTAIDNLKEQGAEVIIVCQHNGVEGSYYPTESQKELARFIIDSGADIYVGHHPHTLQGIELYEGKHILYSLGNFVFGGNSNPKDKDSLIAQILIEIVEEEKTLELNLIPVSISSIKERNDYRPKILEGDEKKRVLDKINELSKDLNFEWTEETNNKE
ncbi:MAG: CapA family protein [Endomicrobia bacterium]|nr:CapA family protein [Endomicrobiia bacterium]